MADTLESLEIEVKHSATGAADEINKVATAIKSVSRAITSALPKLVAFNDALNGGSLSVTNNVTNNIAENMTQISGAARGAQSATASASKGISAVGKAAKNSASPLDNFVSSLKRIAFYRFIRSIIKSITQAFSEGLEKAYLFSTSVGEDGNRFAAAMDRIKSSGNQMKGQLGSAFISLLTAIEPILVKLIDLVTKAADAISQLLAAFTGRTYLKANNTAAQFADTMKSGGKAAKEWKNQLLGFDEINRLNEPSNGGGGGGSNPLEGYDFAATDISEFWQNVANKLKPIIDGIKQIFQGLTDFILGVFTNDWDRAFSGLAKIVDGCKKILGGIIDGIKGLLLGFASFIETRVDGLLTYIETKTGIDLTDVKADWHDFCADVKKEINAWCDDIKNALNGVCDFLKGAFLGDWDLVGQGIVAIFDAAWNAVVRTVESAINWLIQKVNDVLALINSITGLNWQIGSFSIGSWLGKSNELMQRGAFYASGGFPEDGLFMANHGELVGKFANGQTAVANNEQIVEGIKRGVYDAVSSAMSNNNGNGGVTKIYLDGKEIATAVTKQQRGFERATGVSYA